MRRTTTILLFFVTTFSIFSQSPWTQKKGKAFTQLSFTTIAQYEELFDDPNTATERKITDNTTRFYAEYGISDKTSIFFGLPFKTVKSQGFVAETAPTNPKTTAESLSGAGNILLGFKHNFYNKKWLITGQIGVESNTLKTIANAGLRTGYDAWTITPLIIIGRGFDEWHIQTYTGIDYRTNGYSAAYKLGGEIGYQITSWFNFIGFLDGVASFNNGDVFISEQNSLTGLYIDKQSYAAMGIKTIFKINEEFGVNLGIGGAFGGRRIANGAAVSGGIYFKFL